MFKKFLFIVLLTGCTLFLLLQFLLVYVVVSFANISTKDYYNTIADIEVIKHSLTNYSERELFKMVKTYNKITKHSVNIEVMPQTFKGSQNALNLQQLNKFFAEHNYIRYEQYYPYANRWVMFSFHPNKTKTNWILSALIISQFMLIVTILLLLRHYFIHHLSKIIHRSRQGNTLNKSLFFRKAQNQLIIRINELITERVFLVSSLFHDLKSPLTRSSLSLSINFLKNTLRYAYCKMT